MASGDEAAIRQVLAAQQDAWNRADVVAFMTGYKNSPDIAFAGKAGVTRGYQAVLDNYRKRYPGKAAMGTLRFTILEVTPLGASHAKVIGKFELQRDAAGGGDASGYFTLIFEKTTGGWKIIHDHTS